MVEKGSADQDVLDKTLDELGIRPDASKETVGSDLVQQIGMKTARLRIGGAQPQLLAGLIKDCVEFGREKGE